MDKTRINTLKKLPYKTPISIFSSNNDNSSYFWQRMLANKLLNLIYSYLCLGSVWEYAADQSCRESVRRYSFEKQTNTKANKQNKQTNKTKKIQTKQNNNNNKTTENKHTHTKTKQTKKMQGSYNLLSFNKI